MLMKHDMAAFVTDEAASRADIDFLIAIAFKRAMDGEASLSSVAFKEESLCGM